MNSLGSGRISGVNPIKVNSTKDVITVFKRKALQRTSSQERRFKEGDIIIDYIQGNYLDNEMLNELETKLGSMRLLIFSDNSNEILINHGFSDSEVESLKKIPLNMQYMTLDIFDKQKKYLIIMDNGEDRESDVGFAKYPINDNLKDIIELFIKNKEGSYFKNAFLDTNRLNELEHYRETEYSQNDYRSFVAHTIKTNIYPLEFHESREEEEYIDDFLQALAICQSVTSQCRGDGTINPKNLPQKIDCILGGKIKRKILHMVKFMLLSRNENMNGTGYPYGIEKKFIPLEGRLYGVTRSYEILSSLKRLDRMQGWAHDGYIDSDIYRVFLESLDGGKFPKLPKNPDDRIRTTPYQKKKLGKYIRQWSQILKITKDIGELCYEGRGANGDKGLQSVSFKKANELRLELRKIAGIRKVFPISRHGETESDIPGGPSGGPNEILTKSGEEGSHKKGEIFKGLQFRLFTSPLIRARQTAAIICQKVRNCVRNIIPVHDNDIYTLPSCKNCPAVVPEETIITPPNYYEDDRYDGWLENLLSDPNTKGRSQFIKKLVSSPEESINLFITHTFPARNLIYLLENLFSEDRSARKKIQIGNDTVHELYFKGDHLISGEESRTQGLLFSLTNWKSVLLELNTIAKKVFGETFCDRDNQRVNLITLHDQFLDFIDAKNEKSPKKIIAFIKQLKRNTQTKHFYDILKAEGLIELKISQKHSLK